MRNFTLALSTFLFSAALSQTAAAYDSHPLCVAPTEKAGRIFYVDAAKGSKTNDGSAAHPWRQLSEVMAKPPVFQPGDTIYVMNGVYDRPIITAKNADFVKISPAPGQKPLMKGFAFNGASKWIITGFDINRPRGGEGGASSLVEFGANTTNIVFDSNNVYGVPDASTISQAEWRSSALIGLMAREQKGISCLHITNNKISKTYPAGAGLFADKIFFSHNAIDNFLNDGIEFGGDDLIIADNRVTNANDPGDGLHIDGMQGFTGKGTGYKRQIKNITITRNVVIRQTDPNLRFSSYMQGISAFDRDWTNVEVSNNVVLTNAYHGMYFASIHDSRIVNNVVVSDEHAVGTASGKQVWIGIAPKSGDGDPTTNTIASNNISTELFTGSDIKEVKLSNNLTNSITYVVNGKTMAGRKPGTFGDNNIIPVDGVAASFMAFNTKTLTYDLRLKPGSAAIGMGNAANLPPVDIEGKPRTLPADAGAFTKPITKTYSGYISMRAAARQNGTPKFKVLVNGVDLGSQVITANDSNGQPRFYSFNFNLPSKPAKVTIVLEGYGDKAVRGQLATIFNLDMNVDNKRFSLRKTVPTKVTKGVMEEAPGLNFFTNGTTVELDTSKLSL